MTIQAPAIAEPRPPYHHGDLARALLQAAGELIEEEGLESFTLRACARRAGVSHAAPAHHFRDRAGLLSAYAASVFRDMTVQGHERMADAGQNPFARLKAVGLSYVEFAVKRPGAFRWYSVARRWTRTTRHSVKPGMPVSRCFPMWSAA